jgi:hypothetical protein
MPTRLETSDPIRGHGRIGQQALGRRVVFTHDRLNVTSQDTRPARPW